MAASRKSGGGAMPLWNPLRQYAHPSLGAFPVCPIDGDAALEAGQKLMGNQAQRRVSHGLDCVLVAGHDGKQWYHVDGCASKWVLL